MSAYFSIALLCLWPVVHFIGANLNEEFSWLTLAMFYSFSVLGFSALTWAASIISGGKKHAVILSFTAIFFFYLSPGLREISDHIIGLRYLLVSEILVIFFLTYILSKYLTLHRFNRLTLFFSFLLLCTSILNLSINYVIKKPATIAVPFVQKATGSFQKKPNIYFIVLDAYGRNDQLAKVFGFDNSIMEQSFIRAGYQVLSNSYSAFPSTAYAIGSILEMTASGIVSKEPYLNRYNSPVFQKFSAEGYQLAVVDGFQCPKNTLCLRNEERLTGMFNFAEQKMLQLTVLYELILKFIPQLYGDLRVTVRDLQIALERHNFRQPTFVYAHLMYPHPPYTRDEKCSLSIPTKYLDEENFDVDSKLKYIGQLQCVNLHLTELIGVLNDRDPNAIVIIQSDHGPGFTYQKNSGNKDFVFFQNESWYLESLEERYGILNVWKLPNECQNLISDTTPPQDTFSIVFACLQKTVYKPTDAVSFWLDKQKRPIRKHKIRDNNNWIMKKNRGTF